VRLSKSHRAVGRQVARARILARCRVRSLFNHARYDDLARLSQVDCGTYLPAPKWGQSFSYGNDNFGNISWAPMTSHTGTSFQPGTYNPSTNQFPPSQGSYDANGNLTGDLAHNYTWDADSNLSTLGGAGITYDALDRRVEQSNGSSTTEILYGPGGGKLALMNGQSVTKAFVPLPAGATAVYNSSGLAWYRHSDWLGSSRIASTSAGALYYDGAYSPMGETILETGTTDRNFTGQNADLATDLYDFPAREYHPIHGRWISPDPAGLAAVNLVNPQSWNRYAYVNGSPLNSVDPLGLDPMKGYTPAPCNGRNACADYALRPPPVGGGIFNLSLFGFGSAQFGYQLITLSTDGSSNFYYGPATFSITDTEPMPPDDLILIPMSSGGYTWVSVSASGAGNGQLSPCNGKKGNFVNANLVAATQIAAPLGVPPANILGLAAEESGWGTSGIATQCHNFFGIHPGGVGSTFPCQATPAGGTVSGYPAASGFLLSGQSFAAQWGNSVKGIGDARAFAAAIPLTFNSRVAPLGNPKFNSVVAGTIQGAAACVP